MATPNPKTPAPSNPFIDATEMSSVSNGKHFAATTTRFFDNDTPPSSATNFNSPASAPLAPNTSNDSYAAPTQPRRLYKRRFFGLIQLALLNIIVSWAWLTFAPVSATSATYFHVDIATINWLSTSFLFAFTAATPVSLWTLNRYGPRGAILTASVLITVGGWIRYAGARAREDGGGVFALVMIGQIIMGLAQPFVLSAPTFYSELWFSEKGRISATALASLANPFGGALGQLIDPFWVSKPSDVPSMVLYVAIISTIICIPSFFVPARPPTPPTSTSTSEPPRLTLRTLRTLVRNPSFYLIAIPFTVYVSAFNATSSLLVPILTPYSFSETQAGIAGALLILVGLVGAAILSPVLDRKAHLRLYFIKILVPIIAAMYLALIWVPSTRSQAGVYVLMAVLGAASFCLLPLALEMLVDVTYPEVGAEVTSSIAWGAGQAAGGVWIIVMDALSDGGSSVIGTRALVWQAVWTVVAVPIPMVLGMWGTGRTKRVEVERGPEEEAG